MRQETSRLARAQVHRMAKEKQRVAVNERARSTQAQGITLFHWSWVASKEPVELERIHGSKGSEAVGLDVSQCHCTDFGELAVV